MNAKALAKDSSAQKAICTSTIAVVMAVILYVLSVGPAVKIAARYSSRPGPDDTRPWEIVHTVYGPVFWSAKASGTDGVLRAYIALWN